MKKFLTIVFVLISLFVAKPSFSAGSDAVKQATTERSSASAQSAQFRNRVLEIRELAKHNLTTTEKKSLRSELQAMKAMASGPEVFYISGTTLLLIIILLIILL
jgi:hypothetical protein